MSVIARSRRHRFAPVALTFLLIGVIAALLTVLSPAHADPSESADAEFGEKLFVTNCSSCHGLNAEGTQWGPSLIGVGSASVHFQVSTGRMPMAATTSQAEIKPPQLSESDAYALAAYVATLGPGPQIPSSEMVDPALGDPANGGVLFRTNCAMCHNAVGAGGALTQGKFAPAVNETDPVHVYEAMLTGPQAMPPFNDQTITPEEKRDIISFLAEQREPSPSGLSLGSVGPVSEGVWVFIVGIGVLVLFAVWIGARSS